MTHIVMIGRRHKVGRYLERSLKGQSDLAVAGRAEPDRVLAEKSFCPWC